MGRPNPKSIQVALAEREASQSLRRLMPVDGGVDLCSNDYLGLARQLATTTLAPDTARVFGATGSRLVSGSTPLHEEVEATLATFHEAPSALLFGSGYEANLGLLGSLGTRHDTIVYDDLIHASMRDGIRLSAARSFSFRHNDLSDLKKKISQARGDVFIAVESLYSMDGHIAPLVELCDLCDERGAYLVVDEAHATGVFGAKGEGLVQHLGLAARVFARVHTFGKALGYRGGVVVGSHELRTYLINFARPFIYSTAPDQLTLKYIVEAYRLMSEAHNERSALHVLVHAIGSLKEEFGSLRFVDSQTPIQGVVIPTNGSVLAAEQELLNAGIFARAIRSPTVPEGAERIRICLHAYNTVEEVRKCLTILERHCVKGCANG